MFSSLDAQLKETREANSLSRAGPFVAPLYVPVSDENRESSHWEEGMEFLCLRFVQTEEESNVACCFLRTGEPVPRMGESSNASRFERGRLRSSYTETKRGRAHVRFLKSCENPPFFLLSCRQSIAEVLIACDFVHERERAGDLISSR